jgi:hypothetical protein
MEFHEFSIICKMKLRPFQVFVNVFKHTDVFHSRELIVKFASFLLQHAEMTAMHTSETINSIALLWQELLRIVYMSTHIICDQ